MKVLILPGGGAKIGGILGAAEAILDSGYTPSVFAGLSAGSIVATVSALGLIDKAYSKLKDLDIKDVFSQPPLNKKGKVSVSAGMNIICGEHYLGKMNGNFFDTLKEIISPEDFYLIKSSTMRMVWVQVVNMHTGAIDLVNIMTLDYEEALCYLAASSSVPVFSEGWEQDGELIMDGGVRSHLPSRELLNNQLLHISEVVSVYSRPAKLGHALSKNWQPKNVLDVLERTIEIQNIEISKRDAEYERHMCKALGIKLTQIFLDLPQEGIYDFDSERMSKSYQAGYDQAEGVMKLNKEDVEVV